MCSPNLPSPSVSKQATCPLLLAITLTTMLVSPAYASAPAFNHATAQAVMPATTAYNSPLAANNDLPTANALLAQHYLQKAAAIHLGEHITWRRLLHYPDPANTSAKLSLKSQIVSPSFFISPNGSTDPIAELNATLTQLFAEDRSSLGKGNEQNAVQCRFPARTHWLKQMLSITDNQLPRLNCPDTAAWLQQMNPSTASLIFAEEYLDSPASAFGHSFLRLENAGSGQAYILNYEPKVIPDEPFLKFSYKSIIAGNEGVFSVEPYEQKIQQYRDVDGRDIWRYPLNLTSEELQQLARQIWEIKAQHPTYYLTSDNCASEILLLLNALRPDKNYLKNFGNIVAPADIVRALDKQGVLGVATYEPAIKSQQQAALNAKTSPLPKNNARNTVSQPPYFAENNPQTAQPLSHASIAIGQENGEGFTQLGYRAVYHDSLDQPTGYPSGYNLEGLAANLRIFSNTHDNHTSSVRIEDATLLKIRALHPVNTAYTGTSWGGQVGLTQVSDGFGSQDNRHLVGNIGAEYGWSVAYGSPHTAPNISQSAQSSQLPPNICYALGTGNAQVGKGLQKGYRLGAGVTVGCVQQFTDRLRATLELALPYWYQGHGGDTNPAARHDSSYWQPAATLGMQYDMNKTNALRLKSSYMWQPNQLKNDTTWQLGYLYYF